MSLTVSSTRVPHCVTTPSASPHSEACTPWFRSTWFTTCKSGGTVWSDARIHVPFASRTLPLARAGCSLGIKDTAAIQVQAGQVPRVGAGGWPGTRVLLPNNQRQHRPSHAPTDMLPFRICANCFWGGGYLLCSGGVATCFTESPSTACTLSSLSPSCRRISPAYRKVDIRLHRKRNSNSHGARPVC